MLAPTFKFPREVCASALHAADTPAVVLFAIVVAAYADQLYSTDGEVMDPITLWQNLREDFDTEVDVSAENRINAMRTAVETDLFFYDLETFLACVAAITQGSVDDAITGELSDISGAEIMLTLFEVSMVRGEERPTFAPPIMAAIADELRSESEEDQTGQDTADAYLIIHRHKIQDWFQQLGVSEDILAEA